MENEKSVTLKIILGAIAKFRDCDKRAWFCRHVCHLKAFSGGENVTNVLEEKHEEYQSFFSYSFSFSHITSRARARARLSRFGFAS